MNRSALFTLPYLPWAVIILLSLAAALNANTVFVLRFAAFNKETNLEQQIRTITAEKKKQGDMIERLKKMAAAPIESNSGEEGEDMVEFFVNEPGDDKGGDGKWAEIPSGSVKKSHADAVDRFDWMEDPSSD